MQDLADIAVEAAVAAGARYVETRTTSRQREVMTFKDAAIDAAFSENDRGIGVRALFDNGWGYAATNVLTHEAIAACAAQAVAVAKAAAPYALADIATPEAVTGSYTTAVGEDPFAVSAAEIAEIYGAAHRVVMGPEAIKSARGNYLAQRNNSAFAASNGSRVRQSITLCGGGITAIAAADGQVQVRSGPKAHEGNVLQGGFECLRQANLAGIAPQLRDEAIALTTAELAPSKTTTIILDGAQLSLQIHESVGHPTELDRVLGEEISLAGASFLLPDGLDELQFGSSLVNLVADSTTPHGPGTFGFDDEGTPAGSSYLVKDGKFRGYLSGRDTAHAIGRTTTGCLRAETWASAPIVRMVNVNLEPGAGSMNDLIGGVDDGLLLTSNKSWSIDDLRLNFQFGCEIAHEIKGGRLTGKIFRNPTYRGMTPTFWRGCSAIAGKEAWKMWGWMFCGKGDPIQLMYVGHGCAPARFDNVQVFGR